MFIVESKGGAVAIPADMMALLAKEAKAAAAKERPAVSRISLKSGVMSYQGAAMPNNTMEAVVLAAAYRNVWYEGRFDDSRIEARVSTHDLRNALDDLLGGRPVRTTVTRAFGCSLDFV